MKNVNSPFSLALALIFAIISAACATHPTAATSDTLAVQSSDKEINDALNLIAKMPGGTTGYNQLAAIYIRRARETGDFSLNTNAETAVDKALELSPHDVLARKLKASLQLTFHRFAEGLAMGKRLEQEFPDDAFVYGVLTDANAELGNYKEAIEAAQKMVDLKPNSASYARVAHIRSLHGDHKGAVEMLLAAARSSDPADKEAQSWALTQLGKEYFKAGNMKRAEAAIDEGLQLSPAYPLALIEKGRMRLANGDEAAAETFLTQAGSFSTQPEALILLGDIDYAQGRFDEAMTYYQAAEDHVRRTTGDTHRFALLWADRGWRLEEALSIAERDYETNKDIYASDILAWCLFKNGRHSEAKAKIGEALKLNTGDPRILYHAGMIENALGNSRAATGFLRKAISANPNFELIGATQAKLALQSLK